MQRLQTQIQQEGILWCLNGTQVTHQLTGCLGDVGHLTERFRIGQTMIGGIGLTQSRVFVGMRTPVEVTAIHNTATHGRSMTIHILRCRVCHNVSTPFERTAIDRSGKGIIDDQRNAMLMGNSRKLLDIEHLHTRIGNRLTEKQFGVRTERLTDLLFGSSLIDKGTFNTQFLQGD